MPANGIEFPPVPGRIGTHVFYSYGAGGGGVEYPANIFVNLKGRILHFDFDGPYEGKSPARRRETLSHGFGDLPSPETGQLRSQGPD